MQTFYITRDGSEEGPFTENELRSKIQAGEISRNELAWTDSLTNWLPLSELLPDLESASSLNAKPQPRGQFLPKGFSPKNRWIYKMTGSVGELEVFDDKITIATTGVTGFLVKGLKGTKTIPFHSISAIQFKRGGATRGYIQRRQ